MKKLAKNTSHEKSMYNGISQNIAMRLTLKENLTMTMTTLNKK